MLLRPRITKRYVLHTGLTISCAASKQHIRGSDIRRTCCHAVGLEDLRWNARYMFQLHSMFGQPPPDYYMTSGCAHNDDECGLAVFCQPCAFLQLAAEWKVWS